MASPVYVWMDSAQDDSDATWNSSTIAYTDIEAALAAVDANGIVYVASIHTETSSAADLTLNSANGTLANPIKIISVDKTDDTFETMMDGGGYFQRTGTTYDINIDGNDIWIGCYFDSGDDIDISGDQAYQKFIHCKFKSADNFDYGSGNCESACYLEDVEIETTTIAGIILGGGRFEWKGGTYTQTGTNNTAIINKLSSLNRSSPIIIEDVDFSSVDSGDALVMGAASANDETIINRCKVWANMVWAYNTTTTPGRVLKATSCSASDIIYQFHEEHSEGTVDDETSIYLNATYDGTNEYSVKMVSDATYTKEWVRPLRYDLPSFYASANPTLTVEFVLDDATALNDDDLWIEIEYPDGTTGALGLIDKSSKMTNITDTPSAVTSSSVSWTGTGGFSNETKKKNRSYFVRWASRYS